MICSMKMDERVRDQPTWARATWADDELLVHASYNALHEASRALPPAISLKLSLHKTSQCTTHRIDTTLSPELLLLHHCSVAET